MGNRPWVVALVLCGCGRVAFDDVVTGGTLDAQTDARPDATLANHDEDGDGVDDAIDVCPHVSDVAQPDEDGDGVGDGCDPRPGQPTERIVLFDPCIDLAGSWTTTGTAPWVPTGDSFVTDARGMQAFLKLAFAPAVDTITFGGRVGLAMPTGTRQVTLVANETPDRFYYCELLETATVMKFGFVDTPDNIDFNTQDSSQLTTSLQNGEVNLALTTGAAQSCATSWPVTRSPLSAAVTGYSPVELELGVQGIELESGMQS